MSPSELGCRYFRVVHVLHRLQNIFHGKISALLERNTKNFRLRGHQVAGRLGEAFESCSSDSHIKVLFK